MLIHTFHLKPCASCALAQEIYAEAPDYSQSSGPVSRLCLKCLCSFSAQSVAFYILHFWTFTFTFLLSGTVWVWPHSPLWCLPVCWLWALGQLWPICWRALCLPSCPWPVPPPPGGWKSCLEKSFFWCSRKKILGWAGCWGRQGSLQMSVLPRTAAGRSIYSETWLMYIPHWLRGLGVLSDGSSSPSAN